ncbi:uncharacterized protein LOC131009377 [Salvia miltiorrhiza]|uniref:uncharacterized protein LOC131009377 n=1 Tax=Salvia miltiorrhiza TaxID=226208 RepID=UPI0025AC5696|nr:uncharacterized protein LOC131009377 [Salvia miltiorrhiza]
MDDAKDAEFSLKVMINKEKTRVLFAQADSHFADILLSFLTLPLGRIVKVLEKHYGSVEAPTIGSLSNLYRSVANLEVGSHFVTEGAKQALLNPTSSFEDKYAGLKLDITDFQPAQYFSCSVHSKRFRSVSIYYDTTRSTCPSWDCDRKLKKVVDEKGPKATSTDEVFTVHKASFIISDDLQILPNETGIVGIVVSLGITDMDKAELINVDLGFNEIMNLLMTSLTSPTPLSDVILNKTRQINTSILESPPLLQNVAMEENPDFKKLSLKVMIQKSTGKFLYAQAKEEFIEFLFGLLHIPLGGAEYVFAGKTCFKAIDNLYRSSADLIDKYFKSPDTKNRLMKPNLVHGCISGKYIFPLTEECLPADYIDNINWFSSIKFPNGKGSYLTGPQIYHVADDLTVTPLCIVSMFSSLREQKISISDVKEVELEIGLKEALGILKASLTSTSALSDALLSHISIKQPKREV